MSPDERALLQRGGVVALRNVAILTPVALLYGVFLVLFSFSTFTLLQRGLASRPTQAMLGTTLIAFLITSFFCISVILNFVTGIKITLVDSAGMLKDSILEANERTAVFASIQAVASVLIPILNDSVVIWRAWALYPDKQWIMLLPCTLIFGLTGASVAFLILEIKVFQNPMLAVGPASHDVFMACQAFSLGTNVVATSLISYKLWGHLRFLRRMGIKQNSTSPVQKVLIMLVESGLAYCALQITTIVLFFVPASPLLADTVAQNIILGLQVPATAMYPSIVIVLVSLQRSMLETFGFGTQGGIRSVQDIEFSSARPASPGHLSTALNPLDSEAHISSAAACVSKEANADGGPAGKASATSIDIGQIDRT